MKNQYQVSFPIDLAFSLKMQEKEFAQEVRTLFLVKLYEMGKISSGKAGEFLGITRVAFLELLQQYQVSLFNDVTEETLLNDLKNAYLGITLEQEQETIVRGTYLPDEKPSDFVPIWEQDECTFEEIREKAWKRK